MPRKEFKIMQLKNLLEIIDYTEITNRSGIDVNSTEVKKICSHSNDANSDCAFVCIAGSLVDSHDKKYVSGAYGKGCRVFIVQKPIEAPDDAFVITVKDSRIALALLSAAFFDYPANKMTLSHPFAQSFSHSEINRSVSGSAPLLILSNIVSVIKSCSAFVSLVISIPYRLKISLYAPDSDVPSVARTPTFFTPSSAQSFAVSSMIFKIGISTASATFE